MAAPILFFEIPKAFVVTTPKYYTGMATTGIFVAYSEVRSWGKIQQARGIVVVIELIAGKEVSGILERDTIVALDGDWVKQLQDASTTPHPAP